MTDTKSRVRILSVTAKDCRWDYYRGSGKGGQKKNKTSSAVRCTHLESGAVGQAEDERSQVHNRRLAFKRMAESRKFKEWLHLECAKLCGDLSRIENAAEDWAKRELNDCSNTVVETRENNQWIIEKC